MRKSGLMRFYFEFTHLIKQAECIQNSAVSRVFLAQTIKPAQKLHRISYSERCRKQTRRQEHSPPEKESKTYILLHIFGIRLGYLGTFVLGAHTVLAVRNSGWIRHRKLFKILEIQIRFRGT